MNTPEIYFKQIEQELKQMPVEHLPALLNIIQMFRERVCINTAYESTHRLWDEVYKTQVLGGWQGELKREEDVFPETRMMW